ncbi:unnamed protein product [Phytophthora lilii]|uniref:RxLR effector protein n=1 Tax=Phytophthora lilii TaxID=2077276 RepID=A0A9W6TQ07_9STRA|nr:unnamed protein product [Phytophthora lilii]
MRFCYVVLLAATALLASTDALSTNEQTTPMKIDTAPKWHRILSAGGNDKRFLRKRDDEERAIKVEVPGALKKLASQAQPKAAEIAAATKRLGNKWGRVVQYQ